MNRVKKIILSTILLVLIAHLFISSPAQVALAQGRHEPSTPARSEDIPDNVEFDLLTIEHGLSNNGAPGFVQDDNRFMWFDTYDRLNKYDGNENN